MRRLAGILVVMLAASLGCGLSDYEQRMDDERARMKVLDEENQILGELIETPSERTKDKDGNEHSARAWTFDIFLRVPKGAATRSEDKEGWSFAAKALKLYWFKGGMDGYGLLASASTIGKRDKDGNVMDGLPVKEFQENVYEAIDLFLKSKKLEASQFVVASEKEVFRPATAKPGSPGVEVDLVTYRPRDAVATDLLQLNVYFHQYGLRQAAIVYYFPSRKGADVAVKDATRLSLCWLDIGPTAAARRALFQSMRRSDFAPSKS